MKHYYPNFSQFCSLVEKGNTVPVYRFHDTQRSGYLYTISTIERDYILNNLPNYEYQGIVFYVYPSP